MHSAFSITTPRLMGILYFASTRKFFVSLLGAKPFFTSTGNTDVVLCDCIKTRPCLFVAFLHRWIHDIEKLTFYVDGE